MARTNLKVYLDHLIPRDNLLYRRATTSESDDSGDEPYLKIEHLIDGDNSRADLLRKPDFQRATWAWTPDDCVDLLASVVEELVVPSVILWLNPEHFWYVLDGGHRISVLLAWIRDDWGDRRTSEEYKDATLERNSKEAGEHVRDLMRRRKIAPYKEYLAAARRFKELSDAGRDPNMEMETDTVSQARRVRRWKSINTGFPILWVKGDYEKAEASFLRINKTGRQLSPWETTLVENRQSSFARAVMSVARVADKEHCWPVKAAEVTNDTLSQRYLNEILKMVQDLHTVLFMPPYETPITQPQQPLLATPYTRPELQPAYLAELLTITEGNKGQPPETRRLLQRDAKEKVGVMIANGHRLLKNALDVLANIAGDSPRSLNLMPLVYFYNSSGTYVRSLLYAMIYWVNRGSKSEILIRKQLFAAHRGAFESVLLKNKDQIIGRIARRIGSGPEVTYQTALYYDGLLKLLIQHSGDIQREEFDTAHTRLLETLSADEPAPDTSEPTSVGRLYRGRPRTRVVIPNFVGMFPICTICEGRFYPSIATQIDHMVPHALGGATVPSNGRETHPFCNNQRKAIEDLKAGRLQLLLPPFEDPKQLPKPQQLNFLFFTDEPPLDDDGPDAESEDEGDEADDVTDGEGLEAKKPAEE